MRLAHRLLACLLPVFVLLGGCRTSSEAPPAAAVVPQDPAERDTVLAVLQTMQREAFQQAFTHLARYQYTRYTRTEQGAANTPGVAFTESIARIAGQHEGRIATILQADSAGTFDVGTVGGWVTGDTDEDAFATLPRYVFNDPPYLAPRNRDDFLYRLLPDTTFFGAATQVIDIQARPGEGDDQPIRRTRLYLDRASQTLIAVYLERAENTLFFSEESRFYLRLRPAPGGHWVPYSARFRTRLNLPLRAPRRFHTTSAYYRYEPVG